MKAREFLNQVQHDEVVAAIREAELKTSGEIRVFISRKEPTNPILAAQEEFVRLGMTETAEKNAVLIYVAPRVRKLAVIGDAGVHSRCGDDFWTPVAEAMSEHFRKHDFTAGLLHGVRKTGELLAQHFPRHPDDHNELPDEIATD